MGTVTVSPKYQVVIPKKEREALKIKRGQKIQILEYEGRLELIPLKPLKTQRGSLRGLDTSVVREKDRI